MSTCVLRKPNNHLFLGQNTRMSTDLAILSSHLSTLIEARSVSQHELDPLVAYAILETQDGRTSDTRRAQWEYLLKNEVFKLAVGLHRR